MANKRKMTLTSEQLREMYIDKHMSDASIARELSVCSITVANWRRTFGIKRETIFNLIPLPVEELKRMYINEKQTMESMAKHFKCGESTVRAHIVRAGLGLDKVKVAERKLAANKEKYTYRQICQGYRMIQVDGHPSANRDGYIREHRYLTECAIGRYLESGEQVHHINLIKLDNRVENFAILRSKGDHARVHKYMERVGAYLAGYGGPRPEALFFGEKIFWAGKWVNEVDAVGKLIPLDRSQLEDNPAQAETKLVN